MQIEVTPEYLASQGLSPTFPKRFWEKVNKNGPIPAHQPHLGKCWIWTGAKCSDGYGSIFSGFKRKVVSSHIGAWVLSVGTIPIGICVCHHCDIPECVRPDHLFLGTRKDNSQDMLRKGRGESARRYGPENNKTKLKAYQVERIRKIYYEDGDSLSEIAEEYNVTIQSIWAIVHWRNWNYISKPYS